MQKLFSVYRIATVFVVFYPMNYFICFNKFNTSKYMIYEFTRLELVVDIFCVNKLLLIILIRHKTIYHNRLSLERLNTKIIGT